jgi:alpha-mannosidase
MLVLKSSQAAVSLAKYSVPELKRISFEEAMKGSYEPCTVGVEMRPTWSTHWFRVDISVPHDMHRDSIALEFDPGDCEAMIWSEKGDPLMGITGSWGNDRNVVWNLGKRTRDEKIRYWIEVAANGIGGAGAGDSINPPDLNKSFWLRSARLLVFDDNAVEVFKDLDVLLGIAKDLPEDSQISNDALFCANEIVNSIRPPDRKTLEIARLQGLNFFQARNHQGTSAHEIFAVGNCHIDTGL